MKTRPRGSRNLTRRSRRTDFGRFLIRRYRTEAALQALVATAEGIAHLARGRREAADAHFAIARQWTANAAARP